MQTEQIALITPLGLILTLVMGALMLLLPRRLALVPIIAMTCLMTLAQRLIVGGFDFTIIRILIMFGLVRIGLRGEIWSIKLNRIDKIILGFAMCSTIIYVLQWGSSDALVYKLGGAYNLLGLYFIFRAVVRDSEDIVRCVQILAFFAIPLACAMFFESVTRRNPFAIFGGVSEITMMRDGKLRCQGPFAHPILAGTFGASLFPLLVGAWRSKRMGTILSLLGIGASVIITLTSSSSGPVLTLLASWIGMLAWPLRDHMQTVRRATVAILLVLHMVMKAPVWFLIARVDIFSGSTGFHRAMLIDSALSNFWDWWLLGTKSTESWAGEEQRLFDVTNQYIFIGVEGGFLSMVLFVWLIASCFGTVGLVRRAAEATSKEQAFFIWVLGACLFSHAVSFIGVPYFDQMIVPWYLLLAMICSAGQSLQQPAKRPRKVPWSRPASGAPGAESSLKGGLKQDGPAVIGQRRGGAPIQS